MRRSSASNSAGSRDAKRYSTRIEQPTAMPVAARIHKEAFTSTSAGKCRSQKAIKVQKMKPHVEGSAGTVVAATSVPATKDTTATLMTRAIGSWSENATTPSSAATDATSVSMDITPERSDTDGLSRPTMNTK